MTLTLTLTLTGPNASPNRNANLGRACNNDYHFRVPELRFFLLQLISRHWNENKNDNQYVVMCERFMLEHENDTD